MVRAGRSVGEPEGIPFRTTFRVRRISHGAFQRGIRVVEFPQHLVLAPLLAQGQEMWVVVVGVDGLDLAVGHSGSDASRCHPLPACEMRKQVTHSQPVGGSDVIEPICELIGDSGQLSASLTHACQERIPIRHMRSLISERARSNG